MSTRLERERKTIQLMVQLYCRKQRHTAAGSLCARLRSLPATIRHRKAVRLCDNCAGLLAYALQRIDKCPFKAAKPACRACPVHCYKKDMRAQVRRIMAFAGPWMLLYHPILTIRHYLDEWGKKGHSLKLKAES